MTALEFENKEIEAIVEKALLSDYSDPNIILKDHSKYGNDSMQELILLGQLLENKEKYIGFLDHNLRKNKLGFHYYENGDIFVGQWKNNQKNGLGVHIHNVSSKNKRQAMEVTFGSWHEDKFDKEGIYTWLEEAQGNDDIMNCDFQAFVGEFAKEKFRRGVALTLSDKKFYIYYGKFEDGKKHDDSCYFYDNDLKTDRVFRGVVKADVVQEGFFITLHKETIDDLVFMKFNEGQPKEVCTMKDINNEVIDKIEEECLRFRECLYEDDWFGLIYEKTKLAYKIIKEFKMEDFNNKAKYDELKEVVESFKSVGLYNSICNH